MRPSTLPSRRSRWRHFDPWAYVLSANVRRRHLTQMQKREVIGKLRRRRPELSDRALAKLACVSDKTVAFVRAEAEQCAEIPHIPPTERIAADGKKSRARLPASNADAEPEFAPPQTGTTPRVFYLGGHNSAVAPSFLEDAVPRVLLGRTPLSPLGSAPS